jgi:hypothetical protein
MDEIRIGLDFGTHQTKICVCRIPDEGHGIPEYEFFKFVDLKGEEQYFLPSVIQINKDDTVSYGYVNPEEEKESIPFPRLEVIQPVSEIDIQEEAERLLDKYSGGGSYDEEGVSAISKMLSLKYGIDKESYEERKAKAQAKYREDVAEYNRERNLFRYFKQATFAEYPWESKYSSKLLCVWYLAYVIFFLEEKYPDGFYINMGVPTDDKSFRQMRELGTSILISAFHLVEDVYENDIRAFLNEKVRELVIKTDILSFSEDEKDSYLINIFPEAYASLIGLTSRGKLSEGMSINADIGGGTTDISFFIVKDRIPQIYKYWSIPRGLNYIAEMSGFDYSEKDFVKNAHQEIIDKFNHKKEEIVYNLSRLLIDLLRGSGIHKSSLLNALQDRIVVYNGGGSTYSQLTTALYRFTDVKIVDAELWSEEIVKEKQKVGKIFSLLTTAYGLSVAKDDSEVVLCDLNNIFAQYYQEEDYERKEIDKDVC